MLEDFFNDERTEFTDKNIEAQDLMKETVEVGELQRGSVESQHIELSGEVQNLSAKELRKMASNEYAEHGATSLRNAYLKAAEMRENIGDAKGKIDELSFGSGNHPWKEAVSQFESRENKSIPDYQMFVIKLQSIKDELEYGRDTSNGQKEKSYYSKEIETVSQLIDKYKKEELKKAMNDSDELLDRIQELRL